MSEIIRDQEITRQFETTREHRLAHLDRMYDFDPDPEPVTVKASDPITGVVLTHFHMDSDRRVHDLLAPEQPKVLALSGPGLVEESEEVPLPEPDLVILSADDDVTPAPADSPLVIDAGDRPAMVTGSDFPEGMNLGHLLVLARDLADSTLPVGGKVKAITSEDGTVTRLAIVSP